MRAFSLQISLLTGWRRWLLAALAGGIFSFTQAPFHLLILGFVSFPLLIWLMDGVVAREGQWASGIKQAAGIGWWFGFGYFVLGLWWISNALLVEAPEFAWFIPVAVLGLPALLALFYALACALAFPLWSDNIGRIAAIGASFGIAEWLRSFVLTGFPWNAAGYAVMPAPILMQSVTLVGLFGVSALAVALFCLPAIAATGRRAGTIFALVLGVLLIGGHAGYGYWRLYIEPQEPSVRTLNLRIVQPALDQADKVTRRDPTEQFDDLLALSSLPADSPQADIVFWPETAVPFLLTRQPAALAAIGDMLQPGQTLLTGAVREEVIDVGDNAQARFFNSIMMIDDQGIIQGASDKVHLVPFGEYLPFANLFERIGLRAIAQADRGYSAAATRQPLEVGGVKITPLVCYEVIFPHHVGAGDFILNVTNDAWFGNTPGPYQHMHQARVRAVESGIPLVRVANNGISGVFDANGKTISWTSYAERGAVDVALPLAQLNVENKSDSIINLWLIIAIMVASGCIGVFTTKR
ncbi:MAG: apolipoprotein N-acyltransferase [Pseudomonadota bacterium]